MRAAIVIISIIFILLTVSTIRGKLMPDDAESDSVILLSSTSIAVSEASKNAMQESTDASESESIYNFYIGNLHSHTSYSDGVGTPAEAFEHARDIAGVDFLAVTDHTQSLTGNEFADIIFQAEVFTQNGIFVAIAGQEWSGYDPIHESIKNHINVFESERLFTAPRTDLDSFYSELFSSGCTANFNHPAGLGFNRFAYSPTADIGMNAIEVRGWNIWGPFYKGEESEFVNALNNGWHVGVDGSQDNHSATWGDGPSWTVVLACSLTKAEVLDAMRNHRTYSTFDRNLNLVFKAENHWMGESFSQTDNIHFYIRANDPDDNDTLGLVELYQNGKLIDWISVDSNYYPWYLEITPPSGENYYYVKINPSDSQKVWSSPIWVSCTTELPSTPVIVYPSDNISIRTTAPTFVWNLSDNATNYTLQCSKSDSFPQDASTITVSDISNNYYILTDNLENNTPYYWRLSAQNYQGSSIYSRVTKFYVEEDTLYSSVNVNSSNFIVPFSNSSSVGVPGLLWAYPGLGYFDIFPCDNGSFILGTGTENLALDFGSSGLKFLPLDKWKSDSLDFYRANPGGAPEKYTFFRNASAFQHPVLPLEVEVFTSGVFEPTEGCCGDAIFVSYVIHNRGEEPIENIGEALHLDLNLFPYTYNYVDGVWSFSTIWMYSAYGPYRLFGITHKHTDEAGTWSGRGVCNPREIWPQQGWDPSHLWGVISYPGWNMNPYGDQPTDVSIMLIDYPTTLLPDERHIYEYIIWAYGDVPEHKFGEFLYSLMQVEGYFRGDVNTDGQISISDAVYIVNYLFKGGPGPLPFNDQADVNCDGITSVSDIIYMINYLYRNGEPPTDKSRVLPNLHVTQQGDTLDYQEIFKHPGLITHLVWSNLFYFMLP